MNKDVQLIFEAYQSQVEIDALIEELNEAYRQDLINEGLWDDGKQALKKGAQAVGNTLNVFSKKIHDIAKKTQGTAPVQNFDRKVEEKLQQLADKLGKDHKAYKTAKWIGEFAKKHPHWTNFGLVVIGFIIGGLMGGWLPVAAVIGVMRIAVGLMKGEKASTAIGKAAIIGVTGALVGAAIGPMIEAAGDFVMNVFDINPDIGYLRLSDDVTRSSVGVDPADLEPLVAGPTWEGFVTSEMKADLDAVRGTLDADWSPPTDEQKIATWELFGEWEDAGLLSDEYQESLAQRAATVIGDQEGIPTTGGGGAGIQTVSNLINKLGGAAAGGLAGVKAGQTPADAPQAPAPVEPPSAAPTPAAPTPGGDTEFTPPEGDWEEDQLQRLKKVWDDGYRFDPATNKWVPRDGFA